MACLVKDCGEPQLIWGKTRIPYCSQHNCSYPYCVERRENSRKKCSTHIQKGRLRDKTYRQKRKVLGSGLVSTSQPLQFREYHLARQGTVLVAPAANRPNICALPVSEHACTASEHYPTPRQPSPLEEFFERAKEDTRRKIRLRKEWGKQPQEMKRYLDEHLRFIKPIFIESADQVFNEDIAARIRHHTSYPFIATRMDIMVRIYEANPNWLCYIIGWYIIYLDQQGDGKAMVEDLRRVAPQMTWEIQGDENYIPKGTSMQLRLLKMFTGESDGSVAELMPDHDWPGLRYGKSLASAKRKSKFDSSPLNALAPPGVPTQILTRGMPEQLFDLPRFRVTRILEKVLGKFYFCLIGENGSNTGWHVDISAGTRIRKWEGHDGWFLAVLREAYQREDFAEHGADYRPDPRDVECAPLVSGAEIFLGAGYLIAHDVTKYEDGVANGNPYWDYHMLDRTFSNLCYIFEHPKVTNEQIPNELPEVLDKVEQELRQDKDSNIEWRDTTLFELARLKSIVRKKIVCDCREYCGRKCPCRKASDHKEVGCTITCVCKGRCLDR